MDGGSQIHGWLARMCVMLGDSNPKRVGRRRPAAGGRVGGPPPDYPKGSLIHYLYVDLRRA